MEGMLRRDSLHAAAGVSQGAFRSSNNKEEQEHYFDPQETSRTAWAIANTID